jgi:uncharacterized protein (TIGR02391 family)
MIFFTTFVTLIRRLEGMERRLGSPARVEGTTLRLPIGTDVQRGDQIEYCPPNNAPRTMTVIDVIHPHMPGARAVDDHMEVTCVESGRAPGPEVTTPTLHPTMAVPLALMKDGRMSEAVFEALRLVEQRVQALTASAESGHALMESVFGGRTPQLGITATPGPVAEEEREGFQLLLIGAMLGLPDPHSTVRAASATVDETLEYLAVASMLMRRLDRAEGRSR